jgi:hypothetical protein
MKSIFPLCVLCVLCGDSSLRRIVASQQKKGPRPNCDFRNPVAGPSETRRFRPGSSNTPTLPIELTDQRVKLCHNCWQHFKRQFICTRRAIDLRSSFSRPTPRRRWLRAKRCCACLVSFQPPTPNSSTTNGARPQNAHCVERENLFSDTMRTLSTRAEFCRAGGTMVFTILTILKSTRAVTSEKVGGFARLRGIATQNSLPRKSQNNRF